MRQLMTWLVWCAALAIAGCGTAAATSGGTAEDALSTGDTDNLLDSGHDAKGSDAVASDDAVDVAADGGADAAKDTAGGCDFPASPAAGQPGAPCTKADDCDSGFCVEAAQGKICTAACVTCCPSGFACSQVPGNDAAFACLPKLTALCRPCKADNDCAALSNGALCIENGADGAYCGGLCEADSDCPSGYGCVASKGSQGASKQCVSKSGACTCSARSINDGAATICHAINGIGSCPGERKCLASGLTACDAPAAASETCNNIDDDCNGITDDPGSVGCTNWYPDGDGDGFGAGTATCACKSPGITYANAGGDCGDGNPDVHPTAKEACNGIDDDCNGKTDDGFPDTDGDGLADCVDSDLDGDGVANSVDCSPTNAAIHPGAIEQCDGVDNNCDGVTDEEYASGCKFYLRDGDSDGFGVTADAKCLCKAAGLYATLTGGDCNDADATVHPGAVESCNAVDDNCDGATDPADSNGCSNFWLDKDADGYGSGGVGVAKCLCGGLAGWVPQTGDCDDSNFTVHPGATEVCNGIDDNCDGKTDPVNAGNCAPYYADGDSDGWGAGGGSLCLCGPLDAFVVTQTGDCADNDPTVHPGATEVCDGIDNNCDGKIDEGVATQYFTDADGDGWGYGSGLYLCGPKNKFTATVSGDCNDGNKAIYPGADDICDLLDNNCDGVTDENLVDSTYYKDADGDGYGNVNSPAILCGPINGYVATSTDCDDTNAGVHPGAKEIICNGLDDDCVGGDSCDPANCTPQTIADFEGAFGGWTVGPGWGVYTWAKSASQHGFGYGEPDGLAYPDSGLTGSAASTQVLILPGTTSIVLDYFYDPDGQEALSGTTTRDTLLMTLNGVTELNLSPPDFSSKWVLKKAFAVPQTWWGKTIELKFLFTTKDATFNKGPGFGVDNIVTTCQ